MSLWLAVATLGAVLCGVALIRLGIALRRGRVTVAYFVAALVVALSFVAFALADQLPPAGASGPLALALLAPGCVALVVLVREHRRARMRAG